jgi:hypothetical protein
MKQETLATATLIFLAVLFLGLVGMLFIDNANGVKIASTVMAIALIFLMVIIHQLGYGSDDVE